MRMAEVELMEVLVMEVLGVVKILVEAVEMVVVVAEEVVEVLEEVVAT